MKLDKLLNLLRINKTTLESVSQPPPDTFRGELERWCNSFINPAAILAIFAWPLYISIDLALYPEHTLMAYLRWGFTVCGLVALALDFTPLKRRGYMRLIILESYLVLATGIILGMTQGDPVYMGGFSIVILTIALIPLLRMHALLHLLASLVLFWIIGTLQGGMEFIEPGDAYGLYNLLVSIAVAVVSIFLFDMLRRKMYENSRATWNANSELKKANELKNQLLQVAANDLKDPLQVIILYTDWLKNKLSSDRVVGEKLKIVHRSTDRMIKLIAGLLEITSIESGKIVLHRSRVDLSRVVSASAKMYQDDAQKKNQHLIDALENGCFVDGDEMLLRQMSNHLISNAVKFSPPGKSIWLDVERNVEQNSVFFKVRDEGPGLSVEDLDKVFGKFQQLKNKPTGGEIATGLGLAITRDLVTLHDGTIDVGSQPGKGCTFIVTLPLMQEEKIFPKNGNGDGNGDDHENKDAVVEN